MRRIDFRDDCGVAASLRKSAGTADVEETRDAELRDADGRRHAVADIEIGWIEKLVRREGDVDTVVAEPSFVGEAWTEDMVLFQRHDLAAGRTSITPSGKVIALQSRFLAEVLLQGVIAVQTITIGQI